MAGASSRPLVLIRWSLCMPRLSAAPIALTPEQEADLQRLARAHKTPRKLAERAEMILRSAAGTPCARSLASSASGRRPCVIGAAVAVEPRGGGGRRAAFGRPAAGGAGDVRPRADLRDRGAGLREAGTKRSAAQSLEPERAGPRGGPARHRRQHLARLGRALFKKEADLKPHRVRGWLRPSRTLSSRANAPRSARSTMTRPRRLSRTFARSRSTR